MEITEIDSYHFGGSFSIGVKGITLNFFVKHFGKTYIEYCQIDNEYPNSYFELSLNTTGSKVRAVVECWKRGDEKPIFFREYKTWTRRQFRKLDKADILNQFYCWFVLEYGNRLPKSIQAKEYGKPVKFICPKKKKEQG
jgi:hypothetical protein